MDFLNVLLEGAGGVLQDVWTVGRDVGWLFFPFILFPVLHKTYDTYRQDKYVKGIQWVLLEIRVPKDILRTPKAMEQIFLAMYASYSHGIGFLYKHFDGWLDYWYSFEMVGGAEGIRFYIMLPEKQRNMVEAVIYAQYPEAEIEEAEDYVNRLPRKMPNEKYDLWGADLGFGKASAYPIRTYPYFEANVEEQRLDPIAAFAEIMSNLKEGEHLWWQVIVSPSDFAVGNNWVEEGEKIIAKITGEEAKKKGGSGILPDFTEWSRNIARAPMELPQWGEAKPEEKKTRPLLNPAEQEVVKAVSHKAGQLGFETVVRFIYIGKRDGFTNASAIAVMGAERQFNTQDLNQLKPYRELTLVSGWKPRFIPFYAKWMLFSKKKKLFDNYRTRRLRERRIGKFRPSRAKLFTFNAEELATIFHFPLGIVKAPKLRRLDFKTGGPPADLPIE